MYDLSGKVSKDATAKETLRNDFVVMLADNNFENITIKQFKRYKYPILPLVSFIGRVFSLLRSCCSSTNYLSTIVTYKTKNSYIQKLYDLSSL